MILPEFDQEMANTRKMLERIPEDRYHYQPHPKSSQTTRLAGHVADIPSWASHVMKPEDLDLKPSDLTPFEPTTRKELLDHFDQSVRGAHDAIAAATDEQLNAIWSMKFEGKTIMTMPRVAVLRSVILNHLIHHRAQLSVYLRLMDVAVPGMYGPSADDPPFGMSQKAA
jgi:uncharacterized damage-inducible protein DinB